MLEKRSLPLLPRPGAQPSNTLLARINKNNGCPQHGGSRYANIQTTIASLRAYKLKLRQIRGIGAQYIIEHRPRCLLIPDKRVDRQRLQGRIIAAMDGGFHR